MVIVYVPRAVSGATVKVACEVPLPVTDGGENTAVTPGGSASACNVTSDEKPPDAVIETVELPLLPGITSSGDGGAIEKFGASEPTVRETVVERVRPLLFPVMVIGYVPGTALDATMKVAHEDPVP